MRANRRWWWVGLAVLLFLYGWLAWVYYQKAWVWVAWGGFNRRRLKEIELLWRIADEYRAEHGEWPHDVGVLRERVEAELEGHPLRKVLEFPPLTGPHRIEYYNPPVQGGILMRSYGHTELTPGWDLHRDETAWDVYTSGHVRIDGERRRLNPEPGANQTD